MKVLCLADIHLHDFKDFSKTLQVRWDKEKLTYIEDESGDILMNSRLFYILRGLADIRDTAITEGITNILIAGDVFHKRGTITVPVMNGAYQIFKSFKEKGLNIYIIVGNHDQVDQSEISQHSLYTFKDMVHIIDRPETIDLGDNIKLYGIPFYRAKKTTLFYLNKYPKEQRENTIVMLHIGVDGGIVGGGFAMKDEYTIEEIEPDTWNAVILGHYHKPQKFAKNMCYCGTPIQNSFSDEQVDKSYNGFYILDTDTRELEFRELEAPRFLTFKSIDDLKNHKSKYNDYVRIKVQEKDMKDLKEVETDCNVRVEVNKDYSISKRSEISISDSFAKAVETIVDESDIPTELKDKYKAKGLSILSKVAEEV